MTIEWKDATSYSQGERGNIEPKAWDCVVAGVRVWVGSGHRDYPDHWVMHCPHLDLTAKMVGEKSALSAEEAQAAALRIAGETTKKHARFLTEFAERVLP